MAFRPKAQKQRSLSNKEIELWKTLEALAGADSILDWIPLMSPNYEKPKHLRLLLETIARMRFEPVYAWCSVPPRFSKLCADSTPVLTPQGWKTHGDLEIGSQVYAIDGSISTVVERKPDDVASVEVEFTDGEKIKVHPDHLWSAYDRGSGNKPFRTLETKQILSLGLTVNGTPLGKRGSRWRWQLDYCGPVVGSHQDLPIEPYYLGLWLGEGSLDNSRLSSAKSDYEFLRPLLESKGHQIGSVITHKITGVISWQILGKGYGKGVCTVVNQHNEGKHIPPVYYTADIEQRRELLRGLVDSDGTVDQTGRCIFVNTNKRLIDDTAKLVSTLGYRVTVSKHEPVLNSSGIQGKLTSWRVLWTPHDGKSPAYLPRKNLLTLGKRRRRAICAIRPCEPEKGHCIAIDHFSQLYLVGHTLTPTHNTESILHSVVWRLMQDPTCEIAYCTYEANLAYSKSRKMRELAEKMGVRLKRGASGVQEWWTEAGGRLIATGIGGPITGKGCNWLIIDDALKNREEAESPVIRQKHWDWLTSTAMTRVEPGGSVLINATRWHDDDLIGRVQAEFPDWIGIHMPAIYEDIDPDTGQIKERSLWPTRWTVPELKKKRRLVGEFDWASLYQGQPRPKGGRLFKTVNRYTYPMISESDIPYKIIIGADPAATTKTTADYSVAVVLAVTGEFNTLDFRADILEVYRGQVEIPTFVARLRDLAVKWGAPIAVEAVAGFKAVPQMLRNLDKRLRIFEAPVAGDKFTRALPVSAAWNDGRVRIPHDADWVQDFLAEIEKFTGVKDAKDDQVDALAHAYNSAQMLVPTMVTKPQQPIKSGLPFG